MPGNEADVVRSARPKGKKCRRKVKKSSLKKAWMIILKKDQCNWLIFLKIKNSVGSFYE